VLTQLDGRIELVLDGGRVPGGVPSTVGTARRPSRASCATGRSARRPLPPPRPADRGASESRKETAHATSRSGAVLPGLLLIAVGAWLLASTLGVRLPGLETVWPVALIIFGLSFLAQFFAGGRRSEGLVFTGVAAALLGAFFLAITLGCWPGATPGVCGRSTF